MLVVVVLKYQRFSMLDIHKYSKYKPDAEAGSLTQFLPFLPGRPMASPAFRSRSTSCLSLAFPTDNFSPTDRLLALRLAYVASQ